MPITPQKIYDDRQNASLKPSWNENRGYVNEEHRHIFEQTKDIPGWQMEGDSYKLYEMGYFAGDIILEIGTFGGRSAVIELKGALSNKNRREGPLFFGIDVEMESIRRTYDTLAMHYDLIEYCLLYHGDLKSFFSDFPLQPTMVFLDGDHLYEGVKEDLQLLSHMLKPGIPLLCHDYLNPENDTGEYGVRKAATEIEHAGILEFCGVFGCSALFVTGAKCKGTGRLAMRQEEFTQIRVNLLESYGLKRTISFGPYGRRSFSGNQQIPDDNTVPSNLASLKQRLNIQPQKNGVLFLSAPKELTHNEKFYDARYRLDQPDFLPGKGLLKALRVRGADFSLPFLEIGSGTDSLSFGLLEENPYPIALLTDPSFELIKVLRQKLQKNKLDDPDIHLAVLEAEEINQLPENAFSLIALRSTLHHILDVPKFINDSSYLLTKGGFLAFEEPCLEGFVLMGTMAQFLPLVMEKSGFSLKEEQKTKIDNFVQTMKYYARRDLDKASMEDKHLFRPDEIMKICVSSGFAVEFIPNVTFDGYLELGESADNFFSFHNFFRDYLKYCIGFDHELLNLFEKHFEPYNRFTEDISAKNNAPYCYSIFFCRKL